MDQQPTNVSDLQQFEKKPWVAPQLSQLELDETRWSPAGPYNDGDGGYSSLG